VSAISNILSVAKSVSNEISLCNKSFVSTPEMKGSYSIKSVLPALVPELSYNDLEIKREVPHQYFSFMVNGSFEGDVEETRRQLLEYCKLDSYAMVRILDRLRQV
jgi:hypothetical protein